MITATLTHQDARQDFKELLEKNEAERKAALGRLYFTTFIEAVIIPENTSVDFFKEIYDREALLVIATNGCGAHAFIATLKRLMQHEKYAAYRLEASSYYTISVWARG
jgi:hypothetical protein